MPKQSISKNSAQQSNSQLKLQLRGRFIVIEGTDGSGKGTQTELLKAKLEANGIPCEIADFPRYEGNIYGKLVGRYLKGEFGGVNEVNPFLAALTYAGDRNLAKSEINNWLNEGKIVISNRYVMSSKAHMTSKLPVEKREDFINWLDELEYRVNGIPREELVIFLYVPPEIGQKNVDQKASRNYLGAGKRDIHEADANHLATSGEIYLKLSKDEPHWMVIECTENSEMKSREEIHQEILKILMEKGILKV